MVKMIGSVDCDMVASVVKPCPVPQHPHGEHSTMAERHLIRNCKCQRTESCGMTCQDTEPLDENEKCTCCTDQISDDGRWRESQITNEGRHQNTEPSDEQVKCTYYTDHGESQISDDGRWGESQITNDGCHQNTEPLDEQVKCTCYTDRGESKISDDGESQTINNGRQNVKCTCYTDYGENEQNTYNEVRSNQEDSCPCNDKKAGSRRKEKSSNKQNTYNEVRSKQEISCPGNDEKAENRRKEKFLNKQSTYNKVRSKQEDSCPGNVYKKIHYKGIGSQKGYENCEGSQEGYENCKGSQEGYESGESRNNGKMVESLIKNCKAERTEHRGMTCQDVSNEQDTYIKVRSKQEDSCPRDVYKRIHDECIDFQKEKPSDEHQHDTGRQNCEESGTENACSCCKTSGNPHYTDCYTDYGEPQFTYDGCYQDREPPDEHRDCKGCGKSQNCYTDCGDC